MITTTKQFDMLVYNQLRLLNRSLTIKNLALVVSADIGELPNLEYLFIENCHPVTVIDIIREISVSKDCCVVINNYLLPKIYSLEISSYLSSLTHFNIVNTWATALLDSGLLEGKEDKIITEDDYRFLTNKFQENEIVFEQPEKVNTEIDDFHKFNQGLNTWESIRY